MYYNSATLCSKLQQCYQLYTLFHAVLKVTFHKKATTRSDNTQKARVFAIVAFNTFIRMKHSTAELNTTADIF